MRKVHKAGILLIVIGFIVFGTKTLSQSSSPLGFPSPSSIVTPNASVKIISTGVCHARQIDPSNLLFTEPDPVCTPGVVDPTKTKEILCDPSYTTKTVRPPVSYTAPLKIKQIQEYGYLDTNTKDYEEDHLISLELGGSPDNPGNLWPEPGLMNPKDKLENFLHKQVCDGQITLQEAQKEISTDWVATYNTVFNAPTTSLLPSETGN